MSESEIVSSYRTARDPRRQIGILAELNAVTPRVIREVLEEAGELTPKPRSHGGGRPLGFDAGLARQMFEAGLTDEQISAKLGAKPRAIMEWRRRQGLVRPKGRPRPPQKEETTAPEQKEESMALMTKSDSAPAEKTGKAVTVETLFDLLRGAVDAGYGEAPVTVDGCRFAEMHLRVELMMTNSLRLGGEPMAVELQGTPETARKE
nr:MAG TPA: transposase [Caudoviricetes sp.]